MPVLVAPTTSVRASYLAGERDDCAQQGTSPAWLESADAGFECFAAARRQVRLLWDVPTTELWYVDGATYLGTLVIRHRLTPRLHSEGGHIGYNVVPMRRRHGHATAMLAESFRYCRALGLTRLLLTCEQDNNGSRRVIEANGGQLWQEDDVCRYWITLPA